MGGCGVGCEERRPGFFTCCDSAYEVISLILVHRNNNGRLRHPLWYYSRLPHPPSAPAILSYSHSSAHPLSTQTLRLQYPESLEERLSRCSHDRRRLRYRGGTAAFRREIAEPVGEMTSLDVI